MRGQLAFPLIDPLDDVLLVHVPCIAFPTFSQEVQNAPRHGRSCSMFHSQMLMGLFLNHAVPHYNLLIVPSSSSLSFLDLEYALKVFP